MEIEVRDLENPISSRREGVVIRLKVLLRQNLTHIWSGVRSYTTGLARKLAGSLLDMIFLTTRPPISGRSFFFPLNSYYWAEYRSHALTNTSLLIEKNPPTKKQRNIE